MFRAEGCTLNPTGRVDEEKVRTHTKWDTYSREYTQKIDTISGYVVIGFYIAFTATVAYLVYIDIILKEGATL